MPMECPHCHTVVFPMDDGQCPACRKNVNDRQGIDPTRSSLSISMADKMPAMCYHCGQATDRFVYVARSRKEDPNLPSPAAALLISIVSFIFSPIFILWHRTSRTMEVSLHLPQCRACAAAMGKPKPEYVNFPRDSMTFIVGRTFKERLLHIREEDTPPVVQ